MKSIEKKVNFMMENVDYEELAEWMDGKNLISSPLVSISSKEAWRKWYGLKCSSVTIKGKQAGVALHTGVWGAMLVELAMI